MLRFRVEEGRFLTIEADLGLVPFFQDEPPCRGWAGEFDWYFCGFLSSLLRKGTVLGRPGQKVLLKDMGKLEARYLLLFGLGPRVALDPAQLKRLYREFVLCLRDLDVERVAMGSLRTEVRFSYGIPPVRSAVQGLLDGYAAELAMGGRLLSVTILDTGVSERVLVKQQVEAALRDCEGRVPAQLVP